MMIKYAGPTPPYPMADDHADIDDSEWAASAEDEDALHPALHVTPPAGLIDTRPPGSEAINKDAHMAQLAQAEREWADFVRSNPAYDGVDLRGFEPRPKAHPILENLNQAVLTLGILTLMITTIYAVSWQAGVGLGIGLALIITGLTGVIEDAAARRKRR